MPLHDPVHLEATARPHANAVCVLDVCHEVLGRHVVKLGDFIKHRFKVLIDSWKHRNKQRNTLINVIEIKSRIIAK
jgi:hypothetical protein